MTKVRVTKEFTFDCAHALFNYNGPCRNIHGHTYKLYVTVIGSVINDDSNNNNGMIVDFSLLKRIVNDNIVSKYDHALVVNKNQKFAEELKQYQDSGKFIEFDGQTTCENLLIHFAQVLTDKLPVGVELFSLKLYETPTSYGEWFASDNC
jgi:6-pyruvoyltetrahydropterin/6-carboxytetrahydropterin synthase